MKFVSNQTKTFGRANIWILNFNVSRVNVSQLVPALWISTLIQMFC